VFVCIRGECRLRWELSGAVRLCVAQSTMRDF